MCISVIYGEIERLNRKTAKQLLDKKVKLKPPSLKVQAIEDPEVEDDPKKIVFSAFLMVVWDWRAPPSPSPTPFLAPASKGDGLCNRCGLASKHFWYRRVQAASTVLQRGPEWGSQWKA